MRILLSHVAPRGPPPLSPDSEPGGFVPTPRPPGARVAAALAVVALALGFPVLLVVYAIAGTETRSVVGSIMAVMVGATVLGWFFTRSRIRAGEEDPPPND